MFYENSLENQSSRIIKGIMPRNNTDNGASSD